MNVKMLALILALAGNLNAQIDTVTLTNGRSYKDVQIVSQTALYVTVRHSGGVSQIEKSFLPEPLRTQYPANASAAKAEAERERARRAKADAERERMRTIREASAAQQKQESEEAAAPSSVNEESEKEPADKAKSRIRESAEIAVEAYFRKEWRPGVKPVHVVSAMTKINTMEEPQGSGNQWTFIGGGSVIYIEGDANSSMTKGLKEQGSIVQANVSFTGAMEDGRATVTPRIISTTTSW